MPSLVECRAIDYFLQSYNSVHGKGTIIRRSDQRQESPDAICETADGRTIALEHTSAYPPKGILKHQPDATDFRPITDTLIRKFYCNYDTGVSEVWLLMVVRRTLPRERVEDALSV